MSKIFQIAFGLMLMSANCFAAATSAVIQQMSFGKILQTDGGTAATIDNTGSFAVNMGGTALSPGHWGIIRYSVPNGETANISLALPFNLNIEGNGCTIDVVYIASPDDTTFILNDSQRTTDIHISATMIIQGTCANGTYSGVISLNDGLNTNLNVSVTIGESASTIASIKQIAPMNFGELISPNTNSTVTLDYNGNRTPNGISFVSSKSAANGEFQIEGAAGTRINVTFPDSVDMGRGMTVNNFNADTGNAFMLNAEQQRMRVGATLNVPAKIPAGEYSGSYTVTVSY